ncbi:MAG TPA: hypothetical protein VHP32_04260 [Ignavibacteria bacterium]|nr:hypothetical protein [Ignavibacteria bacterium]
MIKKQVFIKCLFFAAFLILFSNSYSFSQTDSVPRTPDTVKIGAYIFSLYDIDFPNNQMNMDFYLWYNSSKDSMHLLENFELVNAKEISKMGETNEKRGPNGEIYYMTLKVLSKVKEQWDITDFPFDRQRVELIIEDIEKDKTKLLFIPDTVNTKIANNITIDGWSITGYGIKVEDHPYETNYGDPDIPDGEYATYSRVIIYVDLEREGAGLFFKLFIGLFISVLISLATFFINPLDLDPRFGLSVGAIFAAIASQYVISSTLPQNQRLTLVDVLHDISFIYIFICIITSIISLSLMKKGNEKASKKLDKICFIVLAVSYILLVYYEISSHVS